MEPSHGRDEAVCCRSALFKFRRHFNDHFVLCACNNRLNLFKLPMKMRKMSMTERLVDSFLSILLFAGPALSPTYLHSSWHDDDDYI